MAGTGGRSTELLELRIEASRRPSGGRPEYGASRRSVSSGVSLGEAAAYIPIDAGYRRVCWSCGNLPAGAHMGAALIVLARAVGRAVLH